MIDSLLGPALGAAIIAGMFSLLGFGVSNWFAERTRAADRKHASDMRTNDNTEWYRRAVFEKRLQAVQEEHVWLMKLFRALNLHGTVKDAVQLRDLANEARAWYDENALLVHGDQIPSSSSFVGAMNSALRASGDPDHGYAALMACMEADKENRARAKRLLEAGQRIA